MTTTFNNADELVNCSRCGTPTDVLAIFPGRVCLKCWEAKEGKQPLTQTDFNGMVNTFRSGGRK